MFKIININEQNINTTIFIEGYKQSKPKKHNYLSIYWPLLVMFIVPCGSNYPSTDYTSTKLTPNFMVEFGGPIFSFLNN